MPEKRSPNGRISFRQYKAFDLLLFLVILVAFELINIFAIQRWFTRQTFSLSVMLLISLIAVIRWNWIAVIFPMADGALCCWINSCNWQTFVVYIIGNAFVILVCLLFYAVPKKKWVDNWYLTLVYAVVGYILFVLGRTVVSLFFGENLVNGIVVNLEDGIFDVFFAIVGLMVLRRINNMLVDQKEYVTKVTHDRDNPRQPDEYHWEGYTELDEEELNKLKAMDAYDRAVHYNSGRSFQEDSENQDSVDEEDLSRLDG